MADQEYEMGKIEKRLNVLELRLAKLEAVLSNPYTEIGSHLADEGATEPQLAVSDQSDDEEKGLESRIGRFGLAWLGNIVLLFGIIFLAQFLMIQGHPIISVIFGYVAAGSIFFLSVYLKKSNDHLAFMFKMNGQILLFYMTLRLHFFSVSPVIADKSIPLVLLITVVCFQVYMSLKSRSQAFGALSVIFALTTAITADTTHVMLPLVTLTAIGSVYYYIKFKWSELLFVTIILCYIIFFLWMVGNPVAGHTMKLIPDHNYGVFYLFALGACYSGMLMLRKNDSSSDGFLIGVTFVNGILFSIMLIFLVLGFYSKNYVFLFSVITVFCLIYSIILYKLSEWNFGSAYYALYGYMAMSIALYGIFKFPLVYLLLSVQSFVVVSMALWFKNKLIVVMNSILFLIILLTYLFTSKSVIGVNFSFAVTALLSARIMNWKKSRLHIETELLRNLYLIEGFVMVLLSLLHAVPKQFITLSWTIAALVYFLIGFILKNVKYRYLALGTLISAAVYLFLVDLARIEVIYRVLALLFFAAISIGISIYYTNRVKKSDN